MKTELQLIHLAEMHPEDSIANSAMKEIRERFHSSYMWCSDCDGRVVKEKDCCINKLSNNEIPNLEYLDF